MSKSKTYEVRVRVVTEGTVRVSAPSIEKARRLATEMVDGGGVELIVMDGEDIVMEVEPAEVVSVGEVD